MPLQCVRCTEPPICFESKIEGEKHRSNRPLNIGHLTHTHIRIADLRVIVCKLRIQRNRMIAFGCVDARTRAPALALSVCVCVAVAVIIMHSRVCAQRRRLFNRSNRYGDNVEKCLRKTVFFRSFDSPAQTRLSTIAIVD